MDRSSNDKLSTTQRILLDRLYNLRGQDSKILSEINSQMKKASDAHQELTTRKNDLENQLSTKSERHKLISDEFDAFKKDFATIKRASYATLLDETHEDLDPEGTLSRLSEKTPKRLEEIAKQIESLKSDIDETVKSLEDNEIESRQLEGTLADAEQAQTRLNELIVASLEGNGSITSDAVRDLLTELQFAHDEITEIGKMILFPEGTLTEYDRKHNEKVAKGQSIQSVVADAKAAAEEASVEEIVEKELKKTTEAEDTTKGVLAEEEKTEEKVDEISAFLEYTKIPSELFNANILRDLMSVDKDLIKDNFALLKSLEFSDETLIKHYYALGDQELRNKVEFFQNMDKTSRDMELSIEALLSYSLSALQEVQTAASEYGLELKNYPLSLLKRGINNYFTNLLFLGNKGITLDNGELTKFSPALNIPSIDFENAFNMFSKYHLSLAKRNGKTALQALAQDTADATIGIDAIIETGNELALADNPDKLSINLLDLAYRLVFCAQNNVPVTDNNGAYRDFIFDDEKYREIFGDIDYTAALKPFIENLSIARQVTNNSPLNELLDNLNLTNYYVSEESRPTAETLFDIKTFTDAIEAVAKTTERTYNIEEITISRERVERNILYLVNKGAHNNVSAEEVLAVALTYGSFMSEEQMKAVTAKMGFNVPAVEGVTL